MSSILTFNLFFLSNLSLTSLCTVNVSPSTYQLTSDIMNINEHDVIMLPDYWRIQQITCFL